MNRKDTILIAVVINAGLLAVLFATAVIYDTDKVLDRADLRSPFAESQSSSVLEVPSSIIASGPTGDEVDNVLNYYTQQPSSQSIVLDANADLYADPPHPAIAEEEPEAVITTRQPRDRDGLIEVTVKKGDALDKIARANGTTISEIKKINQLKNERLSIGQILKVPTRKANQPSVIVATQPPAKKVEKAEPETRANEPVYYVIKSGDTPWKIAKQFPGVDSEDILRLNNLDEERARNLKIGDKIRVK